MQEKILGIVKKGDNKKIFVTHLTVRQSISLLIIKLILIDIIAAVIFFGFFSALFNTNISNVLNINPNTYNTVMFLTLVLGKISLTIYAVIEWLNEYYEITPNFITHKQGIIFRQVTKHDIPYIRSVKINHSLLGSLLNYGTISLIDIRRKKDIKLYLIHNPLKYLHILEDLIPDIEEEKEFFRKKDLEDEIEE